MSPKRVAKAKGLFGAAALAVVIAVAVYVVRHRAPPRPCSRWLRSCQARCYMRATSNGHR